MMGIANLSIAQEWVQFGTTTSSDISGFGDAVALSADGTTMIVGAPFYNDGTGSLGAAIVYRKSTGSSDWEQLGGMIVGSMASDRLGYSVAVSADGSRIAVSLPGVDNPVIEVGKVRVYELTSGDWVQMGSDIETSGGLEFGYDIAMNQNGDVVAITTIGDTGGDVVYSWDGVAWQQKGQLFPENGDFSPFSTALNGDGNRLFWGSPNLNGLVDELGSVYAYAWTGNEWVQLGNAMLGENLYSDFGASVSTNQAGDIVAVSIPDEGGSDGYLQGVVMVFEYNESINTWEQKGQKLEGESAYDRFGDDVQLDASGNTIAIGCKENDNDGGSNAGHVRVFDWNGSEWEQRGMDIDGLEFNENSGEALAISGDGQSVVIAAPGSKSVRSYFWGMPSSISELSEFGGTVGPNPTTGSLMIQLAAVYQNVDVWVYDGQGRLLKQVGYENTANFELELPVEYSGICFLELWIDGQWKRPVVVFKE